MPQPSTARLKLNPPLGRMPVLQFLPPAELTVDASYQRSIEASDSQTLIRRIAQHWNWDLCQPLVVSRRRGDDGDRYFVIDGQHRLEAARMRGDLPQLPCVVVEYAGAGEEAASFVHLNEQRRKLSAADIFKAALASGDETAIAIAAAMDAAGLTLAPHTNPSAFKPGMVSNIGGIQREWRRLGAGAVSEAMTVLATAFDGEVLRYAGTIFPGIAIFCHTRGEDGKLSDGDFSTLTARLARRGQENVPQDVALVRMSDPNLNYRNAGARAITAIFEGREPASIASVRSAGGTAGTTEPDKDDWPWCSQCDARVSPEKAASCTSKFCRVANFDGAA